MRTLYLLRHAKSDRGDPELSDIDRPLAPRGRRDAPAMATYMREHDYRPDLILCSPATRTRETLALLQPALGTDIRAEYDRKLYLGSPDMLLHDCAISTSRRQRVLVGHNPGLERLPARCTARRPPRARRMREEFPTCGSPSSTYRPLGTDRFQRGTLTDSWCRGIGRGYAPHRPNGGRSRS
jgi:phosphohistidine phosphatase